MQLSPSKVQKYFFFPTEFKKYPLLALVGRGEFSHPRLKAFVKDSSTTFTGTAGAADAVVIKMASYVANEKIPDLNTYRIKIIKIFQNAIHLLITKTAVT